MKEGMPVFPEFKRHPKDQFLLEVNSSAKKWVIIVDEQNVPSMVLNANAFLRDALFGEGVINPYVYCHRPILVTDNNTLLGKVLTKLKVYPQSDIDDVIDDDLILIWAAEKRVITGADILGRLLRGIAMRDIGKTSDQIN
jgi:hypothetical protein